MLVTPPVGGSTEGDSTGIADLPLPCQTVMQGQKLGGGYSNVTINPKDGSLSGCWKYPATKPVGNLSSPYINPVFGAWVTNLTGDNEGSVVCNTWNDDITRCGEQGVTAGGAVIKVAGAPKTESSGAVYPEYA